MNTDIRAHEHKWFAFQIKPVWKEIKSNSPFQLYKMVEFAYFSCNCGEMRRSVVDTSESEGA